MNNNSGTSYHVFWQWVSPKSKEGTVTGSRHDENCSSFDECKTLLEEQRKNYPMKDMKLHYLIQLEEIRIVEKGKLATLEKESIS